MTTSPFRQRLAELQLPAWEAQGGGVDAADTGARVAVRGGWLRSVAAALLSVVFPGPCRICEQLLTEARRVPFCDDCLKSFRPIVELAPRDSPSDPWDYAALLSSERGHFAFERAASWSLYEGAVVRAILLLKFDSIEPLGELFAQMLADLATKSGMASEVDVVVPVPLHRDRERERGYNQAAVIAKPLAKRLRLPYKPVLLNRIRPRPDKHILSLEERWESVRGAFATRPGSTVDNLRVLLVDDVLTTGATLDSCAKTLRGAGAKSVVGLTVARARLVNTADQLQ